MASNLSTDGQILAFYYSNFALNAWGLYTKCYSPSLMFKPMCVGLGTSSAIQSSLISNSLYSILSEVPLESRVTIFFWFSLLSIIFILLLPPVSNP